MFRMLTHNKGQAGAAKTQFTNFAPLRGYLGTLDVIPGACREINYVWADRLSAANSAFFCWLRA